MASNELYVFITLLISQTALLAVYIIIRDSPLAAITIRSVRFVSADAFKETLTDAFKETIANQGSSSVFIVNNPIPKITQILSENLKGRQLTGTVYKAGSVEDAGGKAGTFADEVRGPIYLERSDLQKEISGEAIKDWPSINGTRIPDLFQPIDDKEAWLYSAFFDHVTAEEGRPLVRLFGIVRSNYSMNIYCKFHPYLNGFTSTGAIIALPDQHKKEYHTTYLECPLPSNVRPTHVSVNFQKTDKPTNRLQIIYPGPRIRNFTVCYSVLHSGYNKKNQLIESIELNRILGAEHFMVYNYSISPEVSQILSRYQEDGLVTVLQWPIPTLYSWYFAQMTALNDCFYRNRNTSRFVVVVDTDELIVPRSHYTWMELIHNVSPQEVDVSQFMTSPKNYATSPNLTASFNVRSSFFFSNTTQNWVTLSSEFHFTGNETKNIAKYSMIALSQFSRNKYIHPHRLRSKYIARPDLVSISGIHYVAKFIGPETFVEINESQALVHHYRIFPHKKRLVTDTNILKFKQLLYTRIMEQITRFPKIFK